MRIKFYTQLKKFIPLYNLYGFKEGYKLHKKLESNDYNNISLYGVKIPFNLRKE